MKSLQGFLSKTNQRNRLTNLAIILVITAGYVYLLLTSLPSAEESICLFKKITSIPCPGCGMGRSTWSLIHGHISQSLFYHPLGVLFNGFMLFALAGAIRDLIYGKNALIRLLKRPWPFYSIIVLIIVLLAVWARNIYLDM